MALVRPIVALLTDFGYSDWYVASMKGVIKGICPQADFIDITHGVGPGQIEAAAFILQNASPAFPADTIFLAVVDPGVGGSREPVVISAEGRIYVGPNNGLFGFLAERDPNSICRIIAQEKYLIAADAPSATFHGRDVFAPCVGQLATGRTPEFLHSDNPVRIKLARTGLADTVGSGRIIYFDHFGNAITSLKSEQLRNVTQVHLKVSSLMTLPVVRTYCDVEEGSPVAYAGSAGQVEIGINGGNAKQILRLELGDQIEICRGVE